MRKYFLTDYNSNMDIILTYVSVIRWLYLYAQESYMLSLTDLLPHTTRFKLDYHGELCPWEAVTYLTGTQYQTTVFIQTVKQYDACYR